MVLQAIVGIGYENAKPKNMEEKLELGAAKQRREVH